jgi:hypothetical protein
MLVLTHLWFLRDLTNPDKIICIYLMIASSVFQLQKDERPGFHFSICWCVQQYLRMVSFKRKFLLRTWEFFCSTKSNASHNLVPLNEFYI